MKTRMTIATLVILLIGAQPRAAENSSRAILNSHSFWRVNLWHTAVPVRLKSGAFETPPQTIAAPCGWVTPDFDDSEWVRAPGPFFASKDGAGWIGYSVNDSVSSALIYTRGRFSVSDPDAVKSLTLNITYRGGAVVYLNGSEVGRGDMPEGDIKPETTALPYPDEAFVLPGGGRLISGGFGEPKKYADRIKLRVRSLSKISLDPRLLRRGVNVLAIELHRAPYNEIATKKGRDGKRVLKGGRGVRPYNDRWSTVALLSADLRATGDGLQPNVTRPKGFQVWNADPLLMIYDTDYGDAGVDPLPVRIVGARNGRHSGVLVAGRHQAITRLKASVGDLVAEEGAAKVPASAVEIRYQLLGEVDRSAHTRLPGGSDFRIYTNVRRLDALSPHAPETISVQAKKLSGKRNVVFGAVCPVWLTVHVPKDAAAGTYHGVCTIGAEGV